MTVIFLDFEASSLGVDTYPIEVGWAVVDGDVESHLIRPAPSWTDWDYVSQQVHGITQDDLTLKGCPVAEVAARVADVLGAPGVVVLSDQPGWDQLWLDELMAEAGRSDHGIVVQDAVKTWAREARRLLERAEPGDHRARGALLDEASDIVGAAQEAEEDRRRTRHRAGPDAEGLRWVFEEVRRVVDDRLKISENGDCLLNRVGGP